MAFRTAPNAALIGFWAKPDILDINEYILHMRQKGKVCITSVATFERKVSDYETYD
jgi:hypothetical protein